MKYLVSIGVFVIHVFLVEAQNEIMSNNGSSESSTKSATKGSDRLLQSDLQTSTGMVNFFATIPIQSDLPSLIPSDAPSLSSDIPSLIPSDAPSLSSYLSTAPSDTPSLLALPDTPSDALSQDPSPPLSLLSSSSSEILSDFPSLAQASDIVFDQQAGSTASDTSDQETTMPTIQPTTMPTIQPTSTLVSDPVSDDSTHPPSNPAEPSLTPDSVSPTSAGLDFYQDQNLEEQFSKCFPSTEPYTTKTTTMIVEFRYKLEVTPGKNGIDIFPIIFLLEKEMKETILDLLCTEKSPIRREKTETLLAASADPPDFPVDTCGENCFVIQGQVTVEIDVTKDSEAVFCEVLHVIYDMTETIELDDHPGVNTLAFATDYQSGVPGSCSLLSGSRNPSTQPVQVTKTQSSWVLPIYATVIGVLIFAVFVLAMLCLCRNCGIWKSRRNARKGSQINTVILAQDHAGNDAVCSSTPMSIFTDGCDLIEIADPHKDRERIYSF